MRKSIKLYKRSDINMKKDSYSGRKLKLFRKNAGMTQADLADKANVNINTLAKWERNEQCPSIDNARILAKILNKSLDDFFEDDDEEAEQLHIRVGTESMTYEKDGQKFTVPFDRELSLQILKSMFAGENISIINGNNNNNAGAIISK